MKISKLLQLHDAVVSPLALRGNLGDAVLCEGSAIYSRVRRKVLDLGYVLSPAPTATKSLYDCIALLALESILTERVVPVCDNVSPLRVIATKARELDLPVPFLLQQVRRNYLLHESCHCVAHEFLFEGDAPRALAKAAPHEFVLRMALGEAFAITAELFVAAQREPVLALFAALNSYSSFNNADFDAVTLATRRLGQARALQAAMYCALAVQLGMDIREAIATQPFLAQRLLVSPGTVEEDEGLHALAEATGTLSNEFRSVTVPAFFSYMGLEHDPLASVFCERVLATIEPWHVAVVDALLAVITQEPGAGAHSARPEESCLRTSSTLV